MCGSNKVVTNHAILKNAGKVCAEEAEKKANQEYKTYKQKQDKKYISDFDREVKRLKKIKN